MDHRCGKEGEIAKLQAGVKTLFKKTESLEKTTELLRSLEVNAAIQTQILENIVECNQRQDERLNRQEEFLDKQSEVISKINTNLTGLNEGQGFLNKRVGELESKAKQDEELNKVDIRKVHKNKYVSILSKIAVPGGVAVILLLELLKFFK